MVSYMSALTGQDCSEFMDAFKDSFGTDDQEAMFRPMRDALRKLLERTMVAGINRYVGARRFQHSPKRNGQRNGFYHRSLLTTFGFVSELAVPRLRKGGAGVRVFARYQRRWQAVDAFIRKLFLSGVSTREVGAVMESLLDARVSASTVSSVCRMLDAEVRTFHRRRLTDEYRFLILDGVWVKVNGAGKVVKKVILVAYGIKHDRTREIVGFRLTRSESADTGTAFLQDLFNRGIVGERLQLITIDGSKGLHSAAEQVYPQVPLQRCWAHKLRNVTKHLKVKQRKECLSEARAIYLATNRKAALAVYQVWARKWRKLAPEAVKCLATDLEELLTFFTLGLDACQRPTVRTTNAIERVFRELRKRIRPMCAFADSSSCQRIVYALFQTYNNRWKGKLLWKQKQSHLTQKT